MYEPREDSFLIQKHIQEFCKPSFSVLDMGTSSGILAFEAAKYAKKVTAADIDKEAINKLNTNYKTGSSQKITLSSDVTNNFNNITFIHSDLFQNIKDKFDLIIFNPPYLPTKSLKTENTIKNSGNIKNLKKTIASSDNLGENKRVINDDYRYIDLDGGKNGTEIITKFLAQAKAHLKADGKILLLTSSLNKDIEKLFKKYHYIYKLLDEEKFFFEKLLVWVLN